MFHIDDMMLSHLFTLARIEEEHNPVRREKLITDLSKILDYFKQLQMVDTENVSPLAGGVYEYTIGRDDIISERVFESVSSADKLRESFPESERTYLKIPPVF